MFGEGPLPEISNNGSVKSDAMLKFAGCHGNDTLLAEKAFCGQIKHVKYNEIFQKTACNTIANLHLQCNQLNSDITQLLVTSKAG